MWCCNFENEEQLSTPTEQQHAKPKRIQKSFQCKTCKTIKCLSIGTQQTPNQKPNNILNCINYPHKVKLKHWCSMWETCFQNVRRMGGTFTLWTSFAASINSKKRALLYGDPLQSHFTVMPNCHFPTFPFPNISSEVCIGRLHLQSRIHPSKRQK